MMLRAYYTCILLFCTFTFQAQDVVFPTDTSGFFSELKSFVSKSNNPKAVSPAKAFIENTKAGKFEPTQIEQIANTCTNMRQRKMGAFPYFALYTQALNDFAASGKAATVLQQWITVVDKLVSQSEGKHQEFKTFMGFSSAFFLNNLIQISDAKSWSHTTENYTILFEEGKPALTFESGNLTGISVDDTLKIEQTTGTYYPIPSLWKGASGTINWTGVGLPSDTVFAQVGKYEINIEEGFYEIPNATFTYLDFLNKPIKGILRSKLTTKGKKEFPQFESYEKILLNNFGNNIVYKGGFAMYGKNIIGFSDSLKQAELNFYSNNKAIHIQAIADKFEVSSFKEINSKACKVNIYFDGDSIYHPGLALNYVMPTKELKILRPNMKGINIPYDDSYHKLEFKIDGLYWNLDSTFLSMNMIASDGGAAPAIFKSKNYFNKKDIQKYRSFTDTNPIYELKAYYDQNKSLLMPAAAFADALGSQFTTKSIKKLLLNLVEDGFVYYDESKALIQIKEKVLHHGLSDVNKADYDVLNIISESKNSNAVLDFENKNLLLNGVTNVRLSKAKDVVILPRKSTVKIGKNRDMLFNGTVLGGRVDFVGNDFKLDYNNFSIKMPEMQELLINYPSFKMTKGGQPELEPVTTKIENLSGVLYVDDPANKSGLNGNRDFPKFKTDGKAYAYYDEGRFKNLYRRDSFYFEIKPFELDSLWILSPELVELEGKLVSGGIFNNMDQALKIQLDRSLGFEVQAPEAGFPMYNNAGKFKGKLKLNNDGLNGIGNFEALTAVLNSDSIAFYPDSILALCDTFFLDKKVANPHQPLTSSNGPVYINWQAKKDTLYIKKKRNPFNLYNNMALFDGNLLLSSTGLHGRGILNWEGGQLQSNNLKFESEVASALVSDLTIQALDTSAIAFSTSDVSSEIDFTSQLGKFNTDKNIKIDLPYNAFETTLSSFDWDMKEGLINLYIPQNAGKDFYFTSTDKAKEDLRFISKKASYSLNNYLLVASEVPYIFIAGAKIIPGDNELTVNPGGLLDTLYNSTIFADTALLQHKIYDGTVAINTGKQFWGSGLYDFVSTKVGTQTIRFDTLGVGLTEYKNVKGKKDKRKGNALITTGKGIIPEDQNFKLDKLFDYKGGVNLYGDQPFLEFDGYTKVVLKNDSLPTNWFKVKDFIDPENVQIEMPGDLIGENNDTLAVGINFNTSNTKMYTVFMNKPINSSDHQLVKANGFINYDRRNNIFSIGDKDKIEGTAYLGRLFNFNDNKGLITTEGMVNFGSGYKLLDVDVAGQIENDLLRKTFRFSDLVAGFDFLFDEDLLKILGNTIQDENEEADEIDFTGEAFKKGIAELVKPKNVEETIEAIDRTGYYEKSKDIKYQLLLADLDMQFNDVSRTVISSKPFGLAYAGDKYINRMVKGYVEFGNRPGKDYFNIYIECETAEKDSDEVDEAATSTSSWFYFAYKDGELNVLSSDGDFNSKLSEIKLAKRELKEKKKTYRYQKGNHIKKDNFVARMKGQAGY